MIVAEGVRNLWREALYEHISKLAQEHVKFCRSMLTAVPAPTNAPTGIEFVLAYLVSVQDQRLTYCTVNGKKCFAIEFEVDCDEDDEDEARAEAQQVLGHFVATLTRLLGNAFPDELVYIAYCIAWIVRYAEVGLWASDSVALTFHEVPFMEELLKPRAQTLAILST